MIAKNLLGAAAGILLLAACKTTDTREAISPAVTTEAGAAVELTDAGLPRTVIVDGEVRERADLHGDWDEIVCRKQFRTGSRLRKTEVCKSRREWDDERAEYRRSLEKMRDAHGPIPN